MKRFALVLLAVGCAGSEIDEGLSSVPELAPAAVEVCGLVLVPDPALRAETEREAVRWALATGCAIEIGAAETGLLRVADGRRVVRVLLVPELWNELGNPRPGRTRFLDSGELVIEVTDLRIEPVIPHEIGHALNPKPGHVDDGFSLMCSDGGGWLITAADLEYVCEGFPCAEWLPEI